MKKLNVLLLLSLVMMLLFACSSDNDAVGEEKMILVKTVTINGTNITDGKAKQLAVVVLPNNATNRTITWSISDETLATISNTGLLTPMDNGTVTVTATTNDESGISVEKIIAISGVTGPPVLAKSITITGTNITDGNPQQLTFQLLPEEATNKIVTWSVSDALVADITSTGLLTPKLNGDVTVTATATDGSGISGQILISISGFEIQYATILKAENMLLWQRSNGGWPKEPYNDFKGYEREQTAAEILKATNEKENTDTTIDNNHTISEIRTLISAYKDTNNPTYLEAAERGIDFLFEMQYDNGGWPQYYPLRNNYSRHITYNDNAMGNVMNLMRDVFLKKNNFDLISESYVAKAQKSFYKGIQVILDTQVTINGTKTAWCAQHNATTLLPADARDYELASNSGSESVAIVRLLMTLDNPSSQVKDAINKAVAWFEAVKIVGKSLQTVGNDKVLVDSPGNVMWARFYTLGDYTGHKHQSLFNTFGPNEPFFCSRVADAEGGGPRKTIAEISYERRNGYSWYGNWPSGLIGSEYTAWKNKNGI